MIPEPCFGCAPVRHRESIRLGGALELRLVPVAVYRRVALEIEGLLIRLPQPRIEDKFRRSSRIADSLGLGERHVVGHAVLGLAGGEALQENGPAVLTSIQDR